MFTPVAQDGGPEYNEIEKLTELLISQEMDGLYILGSTGQGILFTTEQRKKVAEVVIKTAAKRVPVMVQVGSLTTAEAIILAEHAEKMGADGISAVSPIYYTGSPATAIEHYSRIAEVTNLPFFPYQLGSNSIPGDVTSFIQKVMDIPNVTGMKLTTSQLLEISLIHNYAGDRLKLFSGCDELFCHASLCGTVGAIGSFYNLFGPECKYIMEQFSTGNYSIAKNFMLQFQHLVNTAMPNIWTFLRAAMKLKYNIDIGNTKAPLANTHAPWKEADVISLMEGLEKIAGEVVQKIKV